MRKRMYGPKISMESYREYMENIMKRHENLEKEILMSDKRIKEANESSSEALDELDALFNN